MEFTEDKDIIELYFSRSEEAVSETKKKYGRLILNITESILHSKSDAEECENDTYMTAWGKIPPERPRNLRAFLLKIARNLALKRYEYLTAEKRNPNAAVSLEELGECADRAGDDIRYNDNELAELMNKFLASLNDETRKVFMLRYWRFASINEITEICGISKSKAESMLFRTRNKLKKFLEEEERQ